MPPDLVWPGAFVLIDLISFQHQGVGLPDMTLMFTHLKKKISIVIVCENIYDRFSTTDQSFRSAGQGFEP